MDYEYFLFKDSGTYHLRQNKIYQDNHSVITSGNLYVKIERVTIEIRPDLKYGGNELVVDLHYRGNPVPSRYILKECLPVEVVLVKFQMTDLL